MESTANTIKAIDASTIHQIQSGQVIVDLCSVAKELVENSVDAGATSIEVRFKNQGLDSIEVQDNGYGIAPHNYEGLALKHYTSKLSSYDDLNTLQTFGFRGEALSSLCALSRFTVVTCQAADAPKGTKLEFETSGKLKGTSVVSAQKGTIVSIENLFGNLPVRRRELERNIKREWGKVVSLLNQYACIQTGLKFTLSQQPNKGKRIVLFSTKGNTTTRENIINVFGTKATSAVIPLDLRLEMEPTVGRLNTQSTQQNDSSATTEVHVVGHVSRPAHGEGRQTPDRQMFYVNGRPCQLPQFAKVFNEVYKSYNTHQSPFIFADIRLDTHLYDVNVSPDKRTILLHDQGRMLENLRESLVELFEKQDITVPVSQLTGAKMAPFKKLTLDRASTVASESSRASRDKSTPGGEDDEPPPAGQGDRGQEDAQSGESEDDEGSDDESRPRKRGKAAVSSKSLSGDAQALNLITRWVERKTEDRVEAKTPSPGGGRTSKKAALPADFRQSPANQAKHRQTEAGEDEENGDNEDNDKSVSAETRSPADVDETTRDRSELPIPAVSPPKSQGHRITNLSYSRPLKRSSPEVATITIGDHTVTSVIGSSWKRQRLDDDADEPPRSTSRSQKKKKDADPLPSFGGRLTQMFSAASSSKGAEGLGLETLSADGSGSEDGSEPEGEDEGVEAPDGASENGEDEDEVKDEDDEASDGKEAESEDDLPARGLRDEHDDEDEAMEIDDHVVNGERNSSHEESEDDSETSPRSTSSAKNGKIDRAESEDAVDENASEGEQDYVDQDDKRAADEAKVQQLVEEAEKSANKPTEDGQKRSQIFMKGTGRRKDATFPYLQRVKTDEAAIRQQMKQWTTQLKQANHKAAIDETGTGLEAANAEAEERLSLSISKADFSTMKIIGQFNLGFILAVREHHKTSSSSSSSERKDQQDDELFIIDQHASDEKYNFERLQAQTVVQSQRLVQPKRLELTAMEEETVIENQRALEANGFIVTTDTSGESPVGSRCQLTSLPLSKETTFSLADLEELIALLGDQPSSSLGEDESGRTMSAIPRPSRVRKMFAMRACRSSIMIGRALSQRQMEGVVRHMGEMEKPWNCPHGRPTMRHLCGLGAWDEQGWKEGDGFGKEE